MSLNSTSMYTRGQDFWEYSCAASTSSSLSFFSKNLMYMVLRVKSLLLIYVTGVKIVAKSQKENVSEVLVANSSSFTYTHTLVFT